MTRKRSDDFSAGDSRSPYGDQGGPAARHARSHDVRREEVTRPKGPGPAGDDFDADLRGEAATASDADGSVLAVDDDKGLRHRIDGLNSDQESSLTVLTVGTSLEQGSVYLDLNNRGQGPFKAFGAQVAGPDNRFVAKRDTDYETWDRLVKPS